MIGLFFGGNTFLTQFGNSFGNIELDALMQETHEWKADATMYPVESGQPITDYIIEQPDKLTIKGFVSDSGITLSSSIMALFKSEAKTQQTFDLLYQLIKQREVMTVYTKHKIYTDMALVSLDIPRDAKTGEAIEFNAGFVHIRKVETQTVDVPKGISKKKSGSKLANKTEAAKDSGKKQVEKKALSSKASSVLSRVF